MSNLEFTHNPKLLTEVRSDNTNIRNSDVSLLHITAGGNTLLHIAVLQGKLNLVIEALKQMPELLKMKNAHGNTPLHLASRAGQVDMVQLFVSVASSLSSPLLHELIHMMNNFGNTALHEAVLHDCAPVVAVLLRTAPSVSAVLTGPNGESALHMAAARCNPGIVSQLLQIEGASCEGPNGQTALHAAVSSACYEKALSLVNKMPALLAKADNEGNTPLHLAALYGHRRMAQLLLEGDVLAVHSRDKNGLTPIHIATTYGHLSVVQCLIDKCPDCVELVDNNGCNFFHVAIIKGVLSIIDHVLASATLIKLVNMPDKNGNTPLHLAVLFGKRMVVNKLSSRTEFVTSEINHLGDTALDVVMYNMSEASDVVERMMLLLIATSFELIDPLRFSPLRLKEILNCLIPQIREPNFNVKPLSVLVMFIATATFAAVFALPGGYQSDQGEDPGMAWLSKRAAFDAFHIFDAFAMIISLFVTYKVNGPLRPSASQMIYGFGLLRYSIVALMAAFACGLYAVIAAERLSLATLICLMVMAPLVFTIVRQLPSQVKYIMRFGRMKNRISHAYVPTMLLLPFGSALLYFRSRSPLRCIYEKIVIYRLGPIKFGRYDVAWDIVAVGSWAFPSLSARRVRSS